MMGILIPLSYDSEAFSEKSLLKAARYCGQTLFLLFEYDRFQKQREFRRD
jgi:hypothetical protein